MVVTKGDLVITKRNVDIEVVLTLTAFSSPLPVSNFYVIEHEGIYWLREEGGWRLYDRVETRYFTRERTKNKSLHFVRKKSNTKFKKKNPSVLPIVERQLNAGHPGFRDNIITRVFSRSKTLCVWQRLIHTRMYKKKIGVREQLSHRSGPRVPLSSTIFGPALSPFYTHYMLCTLRVYIIC